MKKSFFPKIIAVDTETSGMSFDSTDPSVGYQIVSLGAIVADSTTFEEIDSIYLEIKWDGESKWESGAEKIHGLSREHLRQHGLDGGEAAGEFGEFILKHFDINSAIHFLGHNVGTFDVPFLRSFVHKYELPFKFAHRHVDTFSLTMPTIQTFNSDEMFRVMGLPKRGDHNSLEDARYALKVVRDISKAWRQILNGN